MIFIKKYIYFTLLTFTLVFSGCQANNSDVIESPSGEITPPDNNSSVPDIDTNATKDAVNISFTDGSVISVVSSGETKIVKLRAFTSNNSLDTEGFISVQYPTKNITSGTDVGNFSPNTAPIVDGIATFTYTAPANLKGRVDANDTFSEFTFYNSTNAEVKALLHIDYKPTSDISSSTPVLSKLVLSKKSINVTQSSQVNTVTLFAYTDLNTTNIDVSILVKTDSTVIQNEIDAGSMSATISVLNGKATFTYTGPSDLLATSNQTTKAVFTLYDKLNPGITVDFTVNFIPNAPTLRIESPTIILTQNSQSATVSILAFNSSNQAFGTGTIFVEYPSAITNGTVSGGVFTNNEASIVNGKAIFNFVGPATLDAIANQQFVFKYKENPLVTTTPLTINYAPRKAEIILVDTEKKVTTNSETITIDINVVDEDGAPYQDGDVKIIFPSDLKDGRDVGSFNNISTTVVNGKANFLYTAPKNLDNNTSDLVFSFYHETNRVGMQNFTLKIEPVANQIVLTSYALESNIVDGNLTLDLNSSKILSFYLREDNGDLVDDSNISSMLVTLLNPQLGELRDTLGHKGSSLQVDGKNSVNLDLKTNTISGVLPIKVTVNFTDANNNTQTIIEVFNIVVLSGPPTAISISYASGTQNAEFAKFEENLVVTVTDKYFNYVNTNPGITTAVIVGYANDNAGNRIYHASGSATVGSIDPVSNMFTGSNGIDFSTLDGSANEFLMTFGTGYKYNALGKWDFTRNNTSATNELKLIDDFNASTSVNDLGFAIGNNQREDTCRISEKWIGAIATTNGSDVIGDNGMIKLKLSYDYYLTGKSVIVAVNLVGYTAVTQVISRIGEAKKITLYGTGLESDTVSISKGFSGVVRLPVKISNTNQWYRNARFSFTIKSSDAVKVNSYTTSMSDINDCSRASGVAFVDVDVTVAADKTGTIQLENLLFVNEF